ncbi:hypothetical protein VZM76_15585 (plasmid) [Lactiplantibacillus plantarum]|uniref:Uncharacterized protein n=1 Tax=Lactiplantibacillus pentosus TaxID=1589 RepID=A0AAX6LIW6_LACPE|nr:MULTISPECIES: hypothetical protein [Lactiplantibacillus]MBU7498488.1 hypothetical protein [Lactiplantibacillus pentosus]MBX4158614.1 hypothetical protein [Lactiplantibacillus plantarum]MCC3164539.1 hypothetical protein [Lactiplantibacillus pentosus]MCJ8189694.1 hypothetical protein [Lactiplantibacillus pentosus]MDF2314521.1 hypothetical protein [Lactiplantibacillus pentosus]
MEKSELKKLVCHTINSINNIPIRVVDFDKFVHYSNLNLEYLLCKYVSLKNSDPRAVADNFFKIFGSPELRKRIYVIYKHHDITGNLKLAEETGLKVLF